MIEATCGACGTVNRFAEGDVPIGAKFMACASCKSRVVLPPGKAGQAAGPPLKPPPSPRVTPPAIPVPVVPGTKPGLIDLADLPAPKRASPFAGVEGSKPAPRSALGDVDLKPRIELDDLISPAIADLPAPKSKVPVKPATGPVPTVKPGAGPRPGVVPPLTKPKQDEIADLPAPKVKQLADLPAPATRETRPLADLPAPSPRTPPNIRTPKPAVPDLPAPRAGGADLPVPRTSPKPDLPAPAPRDPPSGRTPRPQLTDLPAPKSGGVDLPAPRPEAPAPLGFFDDLPQPANPNNPNKPDLPAPKGFFDDLPQPANPNKPDLPAPKGFFDDLPQPASPNKPDLPAPLGFFEDLPQPADSNKPDLPAPKGFFDDLPQPANPNRPMLPVPKGYHENLPQRARSTPPKTPITRAPSVDAAAQPESLDNFDLELGPALEPSEPSEPEPAAELPIELPSDAAAEADALDLGIPVHPPDDGGLDLATPSAAPGIRFGTPKKAAPPAEPAMDLRGPTPPPAAPSARDKSNELELDIEDRRGGKAAHAEKAAQARRREANAPAKQAEPRKPGRMRAILGAVVLLGGLGGGGFYMYQRHQAQQARAAEVSAQILKARTALTAADPAHWMRAGTAARAVLELDSSNADALGIAAEAAIAGALDDGVNGAARIAQGKKLIADALAANVTGPALDRAQALGAIATNQGDRALAKLAPMTAKTPGDPFLLLYTGWAQLAKSDDASAIKAFDQAIAKGAVKVPALYGRARAKLQLADLAGARTDFAAVLEAAKDHVGAQVGLAATLPPAQAPQRESDLLAILARKDIASADPRAVLEAWTLAADVARLGGRLDVARERYRKALALVPLDVPALTGLALVELRDNKLEPAEEMIDKALAQAKDDPDAQLVKAELEIRQGKLGDVVTAIKALAARTPPLPPLQLAHLELVKGKLLDAQGEDEAAVDAYTAGAKAAGDLDLSPTMAAVEKLGALAKKAIDMRDPKKADAYRARADQLLSALADRAQDDPQLAMTLGVAYLQAGDGTKAEAFLRRTVEMRGNDVDAKLELGKALTRLGRSDEAIEQLRAALAGDGARADVELELARAYEAAGHDVDAIAAYTKLLAGKDVDVQARIRAGRFFARKGEVAKAAEQADPILDADPTNSAGHYLKGEGLLAAGKLDDARKEIAEAVDGDPEPQYLDAQGRAGEASVAATGDTKYVDLALRAYSRAGEAEPKLFNPQAGLGRLYSSRKQYDKAITPLLAATKLDPKNSEVMFEIGVAYQALQQKPTAIQWLVAATHAGNRKAEIQWRLAELYFEVNRLKDSVSSYAIATAAGTEEEKQTGKKLDWLSDAWYRLGDLQQDSNEAATRHAWEMYVGRSPEPGVRLNQAKYWLVTHRK